MKNRNGPFRLNAIIAKVYKAVPHPRSSQFMHEFSKAVREADRTRKEKLHSVLEQINELNEQLRDIEGIRGSSSSAQVIDPVLVQRKPIVTLENAIAFFGLLCSFATLFLGFRKDVREAQAAVIAVKRELSIAMSEPVGTRVQNSCGPVRRRNRQGVGGERSHGRLDSDRRSRQSGVAKPPTLETTMQVAANRTKAPTAVQTDLRAIFVSLALSRSTWLITSLSPGAGEKMSKHSIQAGDVVGLLGRFAQLKEKARVRTGRDFPIIAIQEAGLDGFWIHRVLQSEGIESHVVDAASILTSRRRRRAKTDRIDGETLVRTLLAYKRGEPRVCSMVKAPTPEEEDRRRLCRERKTLVAERVEHVNRIKGLLFAQGVFDYEPLKRNRRARLEELKTGDGRLLPAHLKAQISRELDRLELVLPQLKAVEAERDALLEPESEEAPAPAAMLAQLKGMGPEFTAILWSEGLFRSFDNRRQLAAYAGLASTPWQSGSVAHEQGVSKAGNPRLRTTMIQLAWLWLRHQPTSALSSLVPRARPAQRRQDAQDDDRCAGSQAPRRVVEICNQRRRHRGRRDEGRLSAEAPTQSPNPRNLISPDGSRQSEPSSGLA